MMMMWVELKIVTVRRFGALDLRLAAMILARVWMLPVKRPSVVWNLLDSRGEQHPTIEATKRN